jgi:hypothetical protein
MLCLGTQQLRSSAHLADYTTSEPKIKVHIHMRMLSCVVHMRKMPWQILARCHSLFLSSSVQCRNALETKNLKATSDKERVDQADLRDMQSRVGTLHSLRLLLEC